MNNGMPVPAWAEEAKEQMAEAFKGAKEGGAPVQVLNKAVNDEFGTHFAEYELREDTVLVHVFPRGGVEDRYYPSETRGEGLDAKYIPGRFEVECTWAKFPENTVELIEKAAEEMWMGTVAVDTAHILKYAADMTDEEIASEDPVEVDTGAFAIQFHGAAENAKAEGVPKFVDKFCEALDKLLDEVSAN